MRKQQVRTRAEDSGFHTAGEGSEWPLRVPIVSLTPAQRAALTARSEVGEPCRGSAGTASLQNPTSGVTTTQQAGGTPEEAAKQKPRPLLPGAPPEAPWARINIQQRGQSWTKEAEWWPSRDGLPGGPGLLPMQEPKARPWDRAAETAAVAEPAAHQHSPLPGTGTQQHGQGLRGQKGPGVPLKPHMATPALDSTQPAGKDRRHPGPCRRGFLEPREPN